MKDTNFNPFMVLVFKIITWFQVQTLKQSNMEFYDRFTKLHFRLYFGLNLVEEAVKDSDEFKRAQKRHVNMTMTLKFKPNPSKRVIDLISSTCQKNVLWEAKL